MSLSEKVEQAVAAQDWADAAADVLENTAGSLLAGESPAAQEVRDCLHGVWLGHPLHPVITDVPIGAWTAALALDAIDTIRWTDEMAPGADATIAVGLAGALGAAVTGLNDWRHTDGNARRTGVIHAMFNGSATLLYVASLIARRKGARAAGKGLSLLGYAALMGGAYLGGHLVYGERIGVDHASGFELPEQFVAVLPDEELAEGQPRRADAKGTPVFLLRREGRIHALVDTCSHLGGPLSEGEIRDCSVVCPWHGSRFSLEDGRVLDGPSTYKQPCLETRVREGQIEVRAASS
ncbi:MAG TPA: Rieske 2Fe-2S domain-containing protein [Armatimonadota bacterium]|nr:Rieske 2Fe-2S domain-containing protein [Armatimonadota bacterium]